MRRLRGAGRANLKEDGVICSYRWCIIGLRKGPEEDR